MAQLEFKVLTDIIRDFDSEVTVNRLSNHLKVSYSTFARANRSGIWPPSLTNGVVLAVLKDYCDRYFDGDQQAQADFILLHLNAAGIETRALEEALFEDGYDAFLAELVAQVHNPRPEGARVRLLPSLKQQIDEAGKQTAKENGHDVEESGHRQVVEDEPAIERAVSGPTSQAYAADRKRQLVLFAPYAVILFIGVLNPLFADFVTWHMRNNGIHALYTAVFAVAPALAGALIDAPIAWHAYKKAHPAAQFSLHDFARVAKFGAPQGIVPGMGRFNLTLPYLTYQPVCNLITSAACQTLFALLLGLPGFEEFFLHCEWLEYLKAAVLIACFVVYQFTLDQCRKPLVGDIDSNVCENPDNYLPTRVHMWVNNLFLVFSVSRIIVFLISLFAYSALNFRTIETPPLMVVLYLLSVAFFAFSSASPYAVKTRATGVGIFLPAVLFISVGFAALSLTCYVASLTQAGLLVAIALCLSACLAWYLRAKRGAHEIWISAWSHSGSYPTVVTATIFILLFFAFVTRAFV
jgi:hypothetical protein